jgi:phosphatidyl-myo-inositol alpha-mannosyltransferase
MPADPAERPLNSPLQIGICAPYDLAHPGGVNSHIRAQAHALRERGHTVTVMGAASAPLPDGERSLGGCISLVIGGTKTGMGLDPRSRSQVARLFDTTSFDVVHMHEPLMPLLPWFVLRRSPAPIVATFHTHREGGHRWYSACRPLLQPLMDRIAVRLAVSEPARRTVAHHFPGMYEIVPNGVDLDRFQQPGRRPPSMREDRLHVVFVGRLEPRKGVDRLLRAMAAVTRAVPGVMLTIVGDGPDRVELQALARSLGVEVTFEGRVAEDDLPGFYQFADVVCSPALGGESFGIVLLEAMAAARPLVASRIDGYAAVLEAANCATLVDVDDIAEFADVLQRLLADPALRRQLGARAAVAVRSYDWRVIAERLEQIYQRVLDRALG